MLGIESKIKDEKINTIMLDLVKNKFRTGIILTHVIGLGE